ncbi:MAG: helix-turn-helix transcriptional regulator [Alphaproteobacteria bacterium]|nr:helix-turn-helix transcriptional regulator [Alphaproteobacteria bacterium]
MTPSPTRAARSGCPIATTLDQVGDRWTLVVLRDMLTGKSRFADFLASPERITSSVLADRLAAMEAAGLVRKSLYERRPPRHEYRLTAKGEDLLPVLQEICRWANRHIPETWVPPASFMARRIDPPSADAPAERD